MSSKAHNLQKLAVAWDRAPLADSVCDAAEVLLAAPRDSQASAAHFYELLTAAMRALLAATGRDERNEMVLLGSSVELLGDEVDYLLLAYTAGDSSVPRTVIIALRDALLVQLQTAYRQHLLSTRCSDWDTRDRLTKEWLAIHATAADRRPWEFTDCIGDLVESVGAGERLLAQHRRRQPAHESNLR